MREDNLFLKVMSCKFTQSRDIWEKRVMVKVRFTTASHVWHSKLNMVRAVPHDLNSLNQKELGPVIVLSVICLSNPYENRAYAKPCSRVVCPDLFWCSAFCNAAAPSSLRWKYQNLEKTLVPLPFFLKTANHILYLIGYDSSPVTQVTRKMEEKHCSGCVCLTLSFSGWKVLKRERVEAQQLNSECCCWMLCFYSPTWYKLLLSTFSRHIVTYPAKAVAFFPLTSKVLYLQHVSVWLLIILLS